MSIYGENVLTETVEYLDGGSIFDAVITKKIAALNTATQSNIDLFIGATGNINLNVKGYNVLRLGEKSDDSQKTTQITALNSQPIELIPGDNSRTATISDITLSQSVTKQTIKSKKGILVLDDDIEITGSLTLGQDFLVGGALIGSSMNTLRTFENSNSIGFGWRVDEHSNLELYKFDNSTNVTKRILTYGMGETGTQQDTSSYPIYGSNPSNLQSGVSYAIHQSDNLWSSNGTDIYFTEGRIGVGLSNPSYTGDFNGIVYAKDGFITKNITIDNGNIGAQNTISGTYIVGDGYQISNLNAANITGGKLQTSIMPNIITTNEVTSDTVDTKLLSVDGDIYFTGNLYQNQDLFGVNANALWNYDSANTYLYYTTGGVGIGTTNVKLSFQINATDAIKIPVGSTDQRPSNEIGSGMLRYNTTLSQFEGYDGYIWSSIGGSVKDLNQDTYISAENSSGANNDQLKFYTNNNLRMQIDSDGLIGINNSNPQLSFDIKGTDAIKIPIGTTLERPLNSIGAGMLRYNSTISQFEGCDGNIWSSIGGAVMDLNQDTYINAETSSGANNDQLQFYASNIRQMSIDQYGITIDKNASIVGTLNVTDTSTLQSDVNIIGISTLSKTIINSNITVGNYPTLLGGTLNVTGSVALSNALNITGITTHTNSTLFNGNITVGNYNTTLGGTVNITGVTSLSNALNVTGITTHTNSTLFNSNITVGNYNTTLGGTVNITGVTSLSNALNVNGVTSLSNALNVTGVTSLSNTLNVTGVTSLSNTLNVTGVTSLSNTLNVTGITSLSNSLNVTGITYLNSNLVFNNKNIYYSNSNIVFDSSIKINDTSAITIPSGTTLQRPLTSNNGMIRYNNDSNIYEGFVNNKWSAMTGTDDKLYWSLDLIETKSNLYFNNGSVTIGTSNNDNYALKVINSNQYFAVCNSNDMLLELGNISTGTKFNIDSDGNTTTKGVLKIKSGSDSYNFLLSISDYVSVFGSNDYYLNISDVVIPNTLLVSKVNNNVFYALENIQLEFKANNVSKVKVSDLLTNNGISYYNSDTLFYSTIEINSNNYFTLCGSNLVYDINILRNITNAQIGIGVINDLTKSLEVSGDTEITGNLLVNEGNMFLNGKLLNFDLLNSTTTIFNATASNIYYTGHTSTLTETYNTSNNIYTTDYSTIFNMNKKFLNLSNLNLPTNLPITYPTQYIIKASKTLTITLSADVDGSTAYVGNDINNSPMMTYIGDINASITVNVPQNYYLAVVGL
jgi:hypothetical protein